MKTVPILFGTLASIVPWLNLGYILGNQMKTTKVAVAILQQSGRVLACQRKKGTRYELKWEFPGGKVEEGESIEQCLRRELREELDVEIGHVQRTEKEVSHYPDGGSYEVAFCFVTGFHGELKNKVFEQFKWVTPDELRTMDILEGNRDFVSRLSLNHTR